MIHGMRPSKVGCAIVLAGLMVNICVASEAPAATALTLSSPNQKVQLKVGLEEGRLRYAVTFVGRPVLESAPLVFMLDGVEVTEVLDLGQAKPFEINETYAWRGVHARAVNHCRGTVLSLKHAKSDLRFNLELRAFDDGVAFRCVIPGDAKERVPNEATRFILPSGSTVWYHGLEGHYEGVHAQKDVGSVPSGDWAAAPMTFKLPGGAGYAAITEAALLNYSGMALQAEGDRSFKVVLGHQHPVCYPFRLRYSKADIERLARPATVSGTITSPWRVVMIGADLNTLVNCDIVHALCPPADPKLFPKGLDTEWLKPGRAVWKYLDGGAGTLEGMKEFCRLAGELGFEHNVIEGFWKRWSEEELRGLVQYGKQYGVGLWLWKHSKELREPGARLVFFKRCQDAGVVGVKIDFFDHDAREVIDLYQVMLRDAAEHRLMVNFHGSTKPTGEPRTWPNELVRESVKGMEASKLKERARHDATLPFTSYLAGHGDYTPVHFGARRGDTTWAHQVATAAVFTAPLMLYGAHPKTILDNPCAPLIKTLPTTWDETIVLPVSQIGELACFARRRGTTWYLAVVNGPSEKTIRVPLSFLGPGTYSAHLIRDQQSDPAAVRVDNQVLTSKDSLTIDLSSGGGFISRFSR